MTAHRKGTRLDDEHGAPARRGMKAAEPAHESKPKAVRPEESLGRIMRGNLSHMSALNGLVPEDRHKRIRAGQADYLVLSCSDARGHRPDSEEDLLVGVFVRLAGNAVGEKGSADRQALLKALSYVKPDGAVIIESHVSCGAVNECFKWAKGGKEPTGSPDLDSLLGGLDTAGNPAVNGLVQLKKAADAFGIPGRLAAVHYDWKSGEVAQISAPPLPPDVRQLMAKWAGIHTMADQDGGLAGRLEKQAPHAIAICAADLPYSVATITHANQNEIFAVTGSGDGLSPSARASVLYATSHLGPRHIAFIAPGRVGDNEKIMKTFTAWERDLRQIKAGGKRVIAAALNSGDTEITCLRYDLTNGMLARIA